MGFNALIHSHRPDLFDYSKLIPGRNIENLNHAFNVANDELGINKYGSNFDLHQKLTSDFYFTIFLL